MATNKTLTPEALTGKLFQGSFSRTGPTADKLADPIAETPMVLTIEEMIPYERNPRTITNSKYQEIKASIRARGLDQPPSVTRRPGHPKFIIRNGGNTRLSILKELYAETKEERFFRINVLFRPWDETRGEIIALTGHLAENDLQGQLMFIERAMGVENARLIYEQEANGPVSQRELAKRLAADGYPISQPHISKMQETVRFLLPALSSTLYSGLGKHQVERLLSLRKCAASAWETIAPLNPNAPDFETLFHEVLSQFDGDASEFVYERVQDELIGNMHKGTPLTYENVLLSINEQQHKAKRSATLDNLSYVPQPTVIITPTSPIALTTDQVKKDDAHSSLEQTEGQTQPSTPRNSAHKPQFDSTPTTQPPLNEPLSDEERAWRIAGHVVTPVATTERVSDIKRQVAELDGETLPDFKENALISIPVQAGGLYPISDVWYVERELDWPEQLRRVSAQLAREIAEISGLGGTYVIDVPAGLGFICNEPATDVDLSQKSMNTLTLLQALSGVYAIALETQTPEQQLNLAEFTFTAALGQLLLGQPSYQGLDGVNNAASMSERLDDAALVKLFRLIRLGRRLVELEVQQVTENLRP